ncbi:hypothetical protein PR048_014671 [Dryococelus australis]|uniref:HAT C-terminal dimerisation domain-containing protein n=1 Tax=Dryococelus australis TaxID=614101 RepID=A0ABQ9HEV8_9NEOP|nr:hypothetical protein PR048_014671 [Dryococelus australis]
MCETRWLENHDGLIKCKEIFIAIVDTLEELSTDMDSETSSKAAYFVRAIVASDFVICLCCANVLFSFTVTLCRLLQSPACDFVAALQHVELVIDTLKDIRANVDSKFATIFKAARDLLRAVDEEITVQRIVSRQKHRANFNAGDPDTYFRITIMIPLLDDLIYQLESRFKTHKSTLTSLSSLIPSICSKKEYWDSLEAEFQVWQTKWRQLPESDRPTCAIEALGECNKDLFPNIHKLLKILATLPVTTSTPERTFSTMKHLKTYLRKSKLHQPGNIDWLGIHVDPSADQHQHRGNLCRGLLAGEVACKGQWHPTVTSQGRQTGGTAAPPLPSPQLVVCPTLLIPKGAQKQTIQEAILCTEAMAVPQIFDYCRCKDRTFIRIVERLKFIPSCRLVPLAFPSPFSYVSVHCRTGLIASALLSRKREKKGFRMSVYMSEPIRIEFLRYWSPVIRGQVLRADEGEVSYGATPDCKGRGKCKIPEETRRPAASLGARFPHAIIRERPRRETNPIHPANSNVSHTYHNCMWQYVKRCRGTETLVTNNFKKMFMKMHVANPDKQDSRNMQRSAVRIRTILHDTRYRKSLCEVIRASVAPVMAFPALHDQISYQVLVIGHVLSFVAGSIPGFAAGTRVSDGGYCVGCLISFAALECNLHTADDNAIRRIAVVENRTRRAGRTRQPRNSRIWNYCPSIGTNFTGRMSLRTPVEIYAGSKSVKKPRIPALRHTPPRFTLIGSHSLTHSLTHSANSGAHAPTKWHRWPAARRDVAVRQSAPSKHARNRANREILRSPQ